MSLPLKVCHGIQKKILPCIKSITVFMFGAHTIGLTIADIAVVAMSITLQRVRGSHGNLSIP